MIPGSEILDMQIFQLFFYRNAKFTITSNKLAVAAGDTQPNCVIYDLNLKKHVQLEGHSVHYFFPPFFHLPNIETCQSNFIFQKWRLRHYYVI